VCAVQSGKHAGSEENREDHQQFGGAHGLQGIKPTEAQTNLLATAALLPTNNNKHSYM